MSSTNQNGFNYYDVCYGNPNPETQDRDHEENEENGTTSTANEDIYLTVENRSDLVWFRQSKSWNQNH